MYCPVLPYIVWCMYKNLLWLHKGLCSTLNEPDETTVTIISKGRGLSHFNKIIYPFYNLLINLFEKMTSLLQKFMGQALSSNVSIYCFILYILSNTNEKMWIFKMVVHCPVLFVKGSFCILELTVIGNHRKWMGPI